MWIKDEKVQVMCKKEIEGYDYIKGEMHNATLEIYDDCILIWIKQKNLDLVVGLRLKVIFILMINLLGTIIENISMILKLGKEYKNLIN